MPQALRFEADKCANCFEDLEPRNETLFCNEGCRQTADTIRYWRAVTRDRRIARPDIALALKRESRS